MMLINTVQERASELRKSVNRPLIHRAYSIPGLDPKRFVETLKANSGIGPMAMAAVANSSATFSGNFGALFSSYAGLTVRAYRRGDLGVSGTTGTGVSAWANQTGDASAMAPTAGATNGIGTPTAGLNGHAGLASNGSNQSGAYSFSGAFAAPGTTNLSIWAIGRTLVAANGWMHSSGTAFGLYSAGLGGGNLQAWDNGSGMFTNTAVANQWYRIRCTFYGSNEDLRIGNKIGSLGSPSGNVAFNASWGWGSLPSGASKLSTEELCFVLVEGPRATFLTAAADADAKSQTFWSSAIEI